MTETDTNLIDYEFYAMLFDFSRIDELNTFFLNAIKDNNSSGCLEQKILIYNIYMYMREYITFDKKTQDLFIEFCSTDENNKPLYNKDDEKSSRVSFLSLLNNNEVKMIRKYHEDLDFFNNIPDEYNEYYNKLNKNIDKALKDINGDIITYNKTAIPFFLSIAYIFFMFTLNFMILYVIIVYMLKSDKEAVGDDAKFSYFMVYAGYYLKTNFYDRIFKWLFNIR